MLFGREVWNKVQYGAPTESLETELRTGRSPMTNLHSRDLANLKVLSYGG